MRTKTYTVCAELLDNIEKFDKPSWFESSESLLSSLQSGKADRASLHKIVQVKMKIKRIL